MHEEPYGYRVAHHGYLLMYCPGHVNLNVNNYNMYYNIYFNLNKSYNKKIG